MYLLFFTELCSMLKSATVIAALVLSGLFYASCNNCHSKETTFDAVASDTIFLSDIPYSELLLDSTALELFLAKHEAGKADAADMRKFYTSRNFTYAWFTKKGMTEQAGHFLNLQQQYILETGDSSVANPLLDSLFAKFTGDTVFTTQKIPAIEETELLLSLQFFIYTRKAYVGKEVNLRDLSWFIPRKKLDAAALLRSMTDRNTDSLSFREPVGMPYKMLKKYLLQYDALQAKDTFSTMVLTAKKLQYGDTSRLVARIKQKLFFLGDLQTADRSGTFDSTLYKAVVRFQGRHGLATDGVIGKKFMDAFNVPVKDRVLQLLINLERYRWVPDQLEGDFLVVNIPEFKLHVHQDGHYAWNTPVIVGKEITETVIFTSNLKYIVFAPYWNVPASILYKEILPKVRRDAGYLARHHMEWHNGGVRQRPGPDNALGKIKFLFPNSYNIYLHDTPSRNLFDEAKRTFSHGCIRVKNPQKLAEFLLRYDPNWTADSIQSAMNRTSEWRFSLPKTTPVFVGYFTAFVDEFGLLNFREDIYGHDARLKTVLFSDGH